MKKILILTAGFGDGHNAAARSLRDAIELVDDDARNIFALSSVLERRGMKVLTATTGREAIDLVESTPDLAIADMAIAQPPLDLRAGLQCAHIGDVEKFTVGEQFIAFTGATHHVLHNGACTQI